MTRVKVSAGILLLLVGISVFSGLWVKRRCSVILSEVERISELAQLGDAEKTGFQAKLLDKNWENFRSKAAVLVKYDRLVEVDRLCSRIMCLAESESDELQTELSELYDMVEMLESNEIPYFNSVF